MHAAPGLCADARMAAGCAVRLSWQGDTGRRQGPPTCGQELRRHAAHLRGDGGGGRAGVGHVRAALVALNGLEAAHAGQRSLPVLGSGAREAQALVARLGEHHVQRAARQRLESCAARGRVVQVECLRLDVRLDVSCKALVVAV